MNQAQQAFQVLVLFPSWGTYVEEQFLSSMHLNETVTFPWEKIAP